MSVLVDTCIWSQALRRREVDEESSHVRELRQLIAESNALIAGPIRQEVLSGIRHARQFGALREVLRAFPDIHLTTGDYERAAEHFTTCRRSGIQGSNTDFLICSLAERLHVPIFTSDDDFVRLSELLPIRLHRSRFE
jgi:predicted nucleic acid-binding protein